MGTLWQARWMAVAGLLAAVLPGFAPAAAGPPPAVPVAVEQAPSATVASLPATGAVAEPPVCLSACPFAGYWIVSTRRCPQSFKDGNPCCCLDYYHVGPDYAVRNVPAEVFYASLQPCVPLCVIVHGSLVGWEDIYNETPRVYWWLRNAAPHRPVQMVFFTWPSDNVPVGFCPQIEFGVIARQSEYNGFYLAQFVSQLPAQCPISLFGHSYGARLVAAALHLLGGGSVLGHSLGPTCGVPHRIRTVFAAAGIDHHWMNPGDRFGLALTQVESLMNVYNDKDLALHFYPMQRWFADEALGEEGFRPRDLRALGWQACKLWQLNATRLLGFGHAWMYYYARPQIAAAVVPWVYFDEPAPAPAPLP